MFNESQWKHPRNVEHIAPKFAKNPSPPASGQQYPPSTHIWELSGRAERQIDLNKSNCYAFCMMIRKLEKQILHFAKGQRPSHMMYHMWRSKMVDSVDKQVVEAPKRKMDNKEQ